MTGKSLDTVAERGKFSSRENIRVWSIQEREGRDKDGGGRTVNASINGSPVTKFYLRS